MDELYVESFSYIKKTFSPGPLAPEGIQVAAPLSVSSSLGKAQQQIHSSFWLLKQEITKQFPDFFPVQRLLGQIEKGFGSSSYKDVWDMLEKLEELMDAFH